MHNSIPFSLMQMVLRSLTFLGILALFVNSMNAQTLVNNLGAQIIVKEGAQIIIKTASLNNQQGQIINESQIIIEGDVVNQDTIMGVGKNSFQIQGDWFNSGKYIPGLGDIILNGDSQYIGGDSVTAFFNLVLLGTGIKTQKIDAKVLNRLDLDSVELGTNKFMMSIENNSPGAITRSSGFVSSQSTGRLSREMLAGKRYLFPVGSSQTITRYRPVVINSVNESVFAVKMVNHDPTDDSLSTESRQSKLCRVNKLYYHVVDRNDTMQNSVQMTFYFNHIEDSVNWRALTSWDSTNAIWANQDSVSLSKADSLKIVQTDFSNPVIALALIKPEIRVQNDSVINVLCYGDANGRIRFKPFGNTPYNYQWQDSVGNIIKTTIGSIAGDLVTGLTAGEYLLTVIDTNGCSTDTAFRYIVGQPLKPFCLNVTVIDTFCPGDVLVGSVCVETEKKEDYTYDWSPLAWSEACLDVFDPGVFQVKVTEKSSGCSVFIENVEVFNPTLIAVTTIKKDISCFNAADGEGEALLNTVLVNDSISFCHTSALSVNGDTLFCIADTILLVSVVDSTLDSITYKIDSFYLIGPDTISSDTANIVQDTLLVLGNDTFQLSTVPLLQDTISADFIYNFTSQVTDTLKIINKLVINGGGAYTLIRNDLSEYCCCAPFRDADKPIKYITERLNNVTLDTTNEFVTLRINDTIPAGTAPHNYQWLDENNNTVSMGPAINGLTVGVYQVFVTDANGCMDSATITIVEPDSLIIQVSAGDTIIDGETTTIGVLNESGGNPPYEYHWSTQATDIMITVQPASTTSYVISVTDINECEAIDTILVTVHKEFFVFPDGFVPQGDNNIFKPVISSSVIVKELQIFNRWGNFLGNYPEGWDGKYDGSIQPMDTYVYQSVLILPDGSEVISQGDFVLIW